MARRCGRGLLARPRFEVRDAERIGDLGVPVLGFLVGLPGDGQGELQEVALRSRIGIRIDDPQAIVSASGLFAERASLECSGEFRARS